MTATTPLYGRKARLNVGGLVVASFDEDNTGLEIFFDVRKDTKADKPNVARIEVTGLNAVHRAQLGAMERVPVELEAGYTDNVGLIYRGSLRRAMSEHDGSWVTTMESGDGELESKTARINQSFGAKTSLETVVRAVAKSLGLGLGNAEAASLKGRWADGGSEWTHGTVVSGNAAMELTRILESAGLEWSIQDGVIQLLQFGKPLGTTIVELTPQSGLVGSPTIEMRDSGSAGKASGGAKKKGKHRVLKARSLLNPAIRPGGQVKVRSRGIEAVCRVDAVQYIGERSGQQWYAVLEGRIL